MLIALMRHCDFGSSVTCSTQNLPGYYRSRCNNVCGDEKNFIDLTVYIPLNDATNFPMDRATMLAM